MEEIARTHPSPAERSRLWWEIGIVLALSLGQSAIYSVLSLVRSVLRSLEDAEPIASQQTQLNPSRDIDLVWDVIYQVLPIVFDLAFVALVVYLLWEPGSNALRKIGLDFSRLPGDLARGILLLAVIGVPGLALYAAGRVLGVTVTVVAAPLDAAWWTIPVLVFSAVRAGVLEEVILNGYLLSRLRQVGLSWWLALTLSALLRGAYHAYQGAFSIIGNIAMGFVFGWCYRRWGRVMPLVIAHALIDIIAFVGYPLAAAAFPVLFAPPG